MMDSVVCDGLTMVLKFSSFEWLLGDFFYLTDLFILNLIFLPESKIKVRVTAY